MTAPSETISGEVVALVLVLARKCEMSDDANAIELGELVRSIFDPAWIVWDGKAASIPEGMGWVQFSVEQRRDALKREPSEVSNWPWYGEDEKPCVIAYRMRRELAAQEAER